MTLIRSVPFGEYTSHVQGLFYAPDLLGSITEVRNFSTRSGKDFTALFFEAAFKDKSTLRITESLVKERDCVFVTAYNYTYERPSGFSLTYEMEAGQREGQSGTEKEHTRSPRAQRIYKPPQHLHIGVSKAIADQLEGIPPALRGHDGPHYRSPKDIAWEKVLALILVNFCEAEVTDLEKILDKLEEIPIQSQPPSASNNSDVGSSQH